MYLEKITMVLIFQNAKFYLFINFKVVNFVTTTALIRKCQLIDFNRLFTLMQTAYIMKNYILREKSMIFATIIA